MIKSIITITAVFCSIVAASQDQGKTIVGDLRGKQCNGGSGFCGTVSDTLNKIPNANMKNFKAVKISPSSILLELNTNALSKQDQFKFFGKEYSKISSDEKLTFIQEEDYEFSFDVLNYLELNTLYKYLKKGEYPLEIINDKIQVFLTLSKD